MKIINKVLASFSILANVSLISLLLATIITSMVSGNLGAIPSIFAVSIPVVIISVIAIDYLYVVSNFFKKRLYRGVGLIFQIIVGIVGLLTTIFVSIPNNPSPIEIVWFIFYILALIASILLFLSFIFEKKIRNHFNKDGE